MSWQRLSCRRLQPSISKKFALFFAILLAVVIASALVADRSMSRLNGAGTQIDLAGSLRYLTRNMQVSVQRNAPLGDKIDQAELKSNLQRFRQHLSLLQSGGNYSNQPIEPIRDELQDDLSLIAASFKAYERKLLSVLDSGERRTQYPELKELLNSAAGSVFESANHLTQTLSAQVGRTQAEIREALLWLVLLDGAILITGLLIVRHQIVRPLRLVEQASRNIAAGNYGERLGHSSGDEIGRLSRSINGMAAAIESRESELLRSRASLLRANRALRLLSSVNHTMISATNELELLQRMCELAVFEAGYHSAIVSKAEEGEALSFAIVAAEGLPRGWRANAIPSGAGSESGCGVACTTLQESRTYTKHDLCSSAHCLPWAGSTDTPGPKDSICLPIRIDGKDWGMICIYSNSEQAASFDTEEVLLLQELADNLGFGIHTLHLWAERQALAGELQKSNQRLEQRVVERTRALEEANKELEAFSYSVSHDLRAPLRAIDGFANLLSQECNSSLGVTGQDYLARIRRAAQRMATLIDDLLDLSRISKAEITVSQVALSNLVSDIATDLVTHAPERKARFEIAPDITASGDSGLLRALLQNLLENAWKYTGKRPEPQITFGSAESPQGERVFYVADNGVGFNSNDAEQIFQPFCRLHRAEDFPGTGVGLATAARIVSRHGGRIWAQAEPDKGATIFFTLACP